MQNLYVQFAAWVKQNENTGISASTSAMIPGIDGQGSQLRIQTVRFAEQRNTDLSSQFLRAPEWTEAKNLWQQIQAFSSLPVRISVDQKEIVFNSYFDFCEQIMEITKKGYYIQRYKGLGEMNPEQLWETTLNPSNRALLQVSIADAVSADETFSVLMGEQVEPRRKFIHDNALMARSLDV